MRPVVIEDLVACLHTEQAFFTVAKIGKSNSEYA